MLRKNQKISTYDLHIIDVFKFLFKFLWTWQIINKLKNERPTWCHLLSYFTSYVLNVFRTLIYPSSGACDWVVELPHRSSCSQFVMCWRFGAAGCRWCSFCRLKPEKRAPLKTSRTKSPTHNEQDDRCCNSSTQSQAPEDGYINVRNMLST